MIRRLVGSALLLVLALGPAAAGAAEKIRVVVLNVGASDPKLKQLADSIAEQILTELGRSKRLDVIGMSDISAVLGMERQKSILGCTDQSSSCLAEISAAMGAPFLVTGNLARAGKATRVDIKLIRAQDGKAVYRDGKNFQDESEMFDLVSALVKSLVAEMDLPPETPAKAQAQAEVKSKPAQTTPVEATPVVAQVEAEGPKKPGPPLLPWVVVGAGGLVAAGGVAAAAIGYGNGSKLAAPGGMAGMTVLAAQRDGEAANTMLGAGSIAAVAGLGVVAGGVAWALLGRPAGEAPTVAFVPGSNTLIVGGTF